MAATEWHEMLLAVSGGVVVVSGAGYAAVRVTRSLWHTVRRVARLSDAVLGVPEDGRPSLLAEIQHIKAEISPNGGNTDRLGDRVVRMGDRVVRVERMLSEHLAASARDAHPAPAGRPGARHQ